MSNCIHMRFSFLLQQKQQFLRSNWCRQPQSLSLLCSYTLSFFSPFFSLSHTHQTRACMCTTHTHTHTLSVFKKKEGRPDKSQFVPFCESLPLACLRQSQTWKVLRAGSRPTSAIDWPHWGFVCGGNQSDSSVHTPWPSTPGNEDPSLPQKQEINKKSSACLHQCPSCFFFFFWFISRLLIWRRLI